MRRLPVVHELTNVLSYKHVWANVFVYLHISVYIHIQ